MTELDFARAGDAATVAALFRARRARAEAMTGAPLRRLAAAATSAAGAAALDALAALLIRIGARRARSPLARCGCAPARA